MAGNWQALKRELKVHGWLLFGPVAVMWIVQVVNALTLHSLDRFGLRPWSIPGLIGIVTMPFLHLGFAHLMANTVLFLVFGALILMHNVRDYVAVWLTTLLVAGVGTWLTGMPGSTHIGASGIVFGFLGYLMLRGFFRRSVWSILLSLVIGVMYGYQLWGVLPQGGISWQGHLFGFLGGGLSAYMLCRGQRRPVAAPTRVAVG